jgi:SM-20-related protein
MPDVKLLQLEDFLTDEEHAELIRFVQHHEADLVTSTVNPDGGSTYEVDDDYRRSRVLYEIGPIEPMFDARLRALLPHLRKELDVAWFELDRLESQLTASGDGDFFGIHTDSGGPEVVTRRLTYVYYFSMRPDAFTGGELKVYDNVLRDGFYHPADTFTTVEPRDNSVVFFPSVLFHEVMPVHTSGDALTDHRFTVNGWFHSSRPEPEPAHDSNEESPPLLDSN